MAWVARGVYILHHGSEVERLSVFIGSDRAVGATTDYASIVPWIAEGCQWQRGISVRIRFHLTLGRTVGTMGGWYIMPEVP